MGGATGLERILVNEDGAQRVQVALDGVGLTLGDRPVFRDLSCEFPRGEITVVLGGSGSGKSTILRLIGGLQRPDRGRICIAGNDVTHYSEAQLFAVRNRIGMLFQGGALLDSMTIFDNVSLPLREHTDLSEAAIADHVGERLEAVGLPGTGALYPRQLSGGMMRRAGLARALVRDPEMVLCDEPFSGLDPVNVRRIEALLVELSRRLEVTMIVTSHHLASSLRMATRLLFLVDGEAFSGSTAEVLANSDPRIVEFLRAERGDSPRLGGAETGAVGGDGAR